ncbi:unnamed protein product [Danaus chrysippus]|uniref:(African queen) hypothetical protein n=1 Tax=Danaus chrysippus TaxID=151541 RepID=A0A8J2R263_9NEOP|nr:unnamed protein product [Danaus chrysippus]
MSNVSLFIFLVTVIVTGLASSECPVDRDIDLHDEARLHRDLTCPYNGDYRPVKDHKNTVVVKIRLALKYMTFDSTEEKITIHSWVALNWQDEFLKWNPSDYGNINEIQLESHEVWSPRLALFNADANSYPSDRIYTTCLLTNNGLMTCVPQLAHTGICRTSLSRWPYDEQNCTLYFGSWMHTGEQVNFTFYNSRPVVLDDFQNAPGWKLLKVVNERLPGKYTCCPNSTYPMLKYTFILRREAAGPAAIVVIPSIVLVLITLSSLLLDVKDNIRLMLVCFSLFGHFTFITEIGYIVPKLSSDTPIILLFVRDSMIVTLVGILETLLLMSLRKRVVPAPTWIVSVNRLVTSGPGKYVVFTEFDPCEGLEGKTITDEGTANTSEDRTRINMDWINFANFVNSCVFIISFVVYLILVCTYIPRDD